MNICPMKKRTGLLPLALVLAALSVAPSGIAVALDVEEVKVLLQNQVGEDIIINMVETDGTIYITPEQANEFRAQGASEDLISALRPYPVTVGDAAALSGTANPGTIAATGSSAALITPAPATAAVAAGPADGSPITPVAISLAAATPPRYAKEGWLSVSNHDWTTYYMNIDVGAKRIFLSKAPNGGMAIQSGQNVVVNVRKEGYRMYGDNGNDLRVKIRENETTRVSLNPFGVFGNSGLTGVAVDRDDVRSEVIFNNYVPTPTVIVEESPVIVIPRGRPPIPPVYRHYGPPYYRPYRDSGGFFYYYR